MKNITEITAIITNMEETLFNKIAQAEHDYWELDSKVSKNGRQRMIYNLRKVGLTVDEWFAWVNL